MGDAAHAMVPFYGQGMNCGFQDVSVLFSILEKNNFDFEKSLEEYSIVRNPDAEAICDLALNNYIEMRSTVTSTMFHVRKKVEGVLNFFFPKSIIPLYTMVAFTEIPYAEVMRRWQRQTVLFNRIVFGFEVSFAMAIGFGIFKFKHLFLK